MSQNRPRTASSVRRSARAPPPWSGLRRRRAGRAAPSSRSTRPSYSSVPNIADPVRVDRDRRAGSPSAAARAPVAPLARQHGREAVGAVAQQHRSRAGVGCRRRWLACIAPAVERSPCRRRAVRGTPGSPGSRSPRSATGSERAWSIASPVRALGYDERDGAGVRLEVEDVLHEVAAEGLVGQGCRCRSRAPSGACALQPRYPSPPRAGSRRDPGGRLRDGAHSIRHAAPRSIRDRPAVGWGRRARQLVGEDARDGARISRSASSASRAP